MKETLRALYNQEVERARLDFDGDRDYQAYYTQSQALWKEGDMPEPFFHLLDASNYLAFSHSFRLGMLEAFSLPGGREVPPPRRHRRRKVHCTRNSLAGIARYVPLLLLSKPDPLRWAPVWGRPSAAFRAQPRGSAVIHRPPWPGGRSRTIRHPGRPVAVILADETTPQTWAGTEAGERRPLNFGPG